MKYGPLTFQCQPFMQDELRGKMEKFNVYLFVFVFCCHNKARQNSNSQWAW